jgi:methionyl-tRNA formyltransferase
VGLVLHPPERRRFGEQILQAAGVPEGGVLDATHLPRPEVVERIEALEPELGLSILFGYLLRPEVIDLFPRGIVNLHTGLLPYNRGAFPNVWSLVDRTPAGVTLHYIDETIDGGDIVAQRAVAKEPTDTGETLYNRLEDAALGLFRDTWASLVDGTAAAVPQAEGGTFHRRADVDAIDAIDLERSYRAADLIDILRARTFPPHKGAYFESGDRRVYLRLELREDETREER